MRLDKLSESEINFLIEAAFQKAHITGRGIKSCKQIAAMIKYKTHQSISETTIYRMLNIDKYHIRPYEHTLQALTEFIEANENQILDHHSESKVQLNGYQALQPFKDLLFISLKNQRIQEIDYFLKKLPSEYGASKEQQFFIAHIFGSFFRRAYQDPKRIKMLHQLIKIPNFTLYYFETYPDYDHVDGFFYESLEKNIRYWKYFEYLDQSKNLKQKECSNYMRQAIFCFSLWFNLSFILQKKESLVKTGKAFFEKEDFSTTILNKEHQGLKLCVRFLTAQYHYRMAAGYDVAYCNAQLVDQYKALVNSSSSDFHEKVFTSVMVADALIIADQPFDSLAFIFRDRRLILEATKQFEPAYTRFLKYARTINEPLLIPDKFTNSNVHYSRGFYEIGHHEQLLRRLNLKNTIDKA